MKHTPTPWRYIEFADSSDCFVQADRSKPDHPYDIEILGDDTNSKFYPLEQKKADAKRIVECVNLFHEIEDPTAYMKNINAMLLKASDAVNENVALKKQIEMMRGQIDDKIALIKERDGLREQVRKLSELTGQLTHSGLSGQTSSQTELANESALFSEAEIEAHRLAELSAGANAEDTRNTMHDLDIIEKRVNVLIDKTFLAFSIVVVVVVVLTIHSIIQIIQFITK